MDRRRGARYRPGVDPRPIVLSGSTIRLEPLDAAHAADLAVVGRDAEIWTYMQQGPFADVGDALAMIEGAMRYARAGRELPFAIVLRSNGRAIGSTRYMDIRREHRGLEIGATWIGLAFQRTGINTECKRLLLGHAFEDLGALRVQLKTDHLNVRSQRAIDRLGAVREGVLRQHMSRRDGSQRDTVMYSVIASEWPAMRARLDQLLTRDRPN